MLHTPAASIAMATALEAASRGVRTEAILGKFEALLVVWEDAPPLEMVRRVVYRRRETLARHSMFSAQDLSRLSAGEIEALVGSLDFAEALMTRGADEVPGPGTPTPQETQCVDILTRYARCYRQWRTLEKPVKLLRALQEGPDAVSMLAGLAHGVQESRDTWADRLARCETEMKKSAREALDGDELRRFIWGK